jgi:hypothetical protein
VRAAVLLQDLTGRGVTLEAHGPDLVVDGPADALSDEIVETLRAIKTELLVLLSSGADKPEWDAADWQVYLNQRAAVREHDDRLSRAEAERLAFEDAVTHWLCLHPAHATDPRRGCVQCGEGDQAGNTLLPVLAPDGHVWVHDQCWEAWSASRRQDARKVLRHLGLELAGSPAGLHSPHQLRRSG